MTGNVVLLGMGIVGAEDLPVLQPALALLAFMLGAAVAGRGLRHKSAGWSARISAHVLLVGVLAAALTVFIAIVDPAEREMYGHVTTSTLGFIMGVQAATARRLKVAEITAVVVTSTIPGLAADSRLAGGSGVMWARRLLATVLILLGATLGALAFKIDLWLGSAVTALIVTVVAAVGHLRYRADARLESTSIVCAAL